MMKIIETIKTIKLLIRCKKLPYELRYYDDVLSEFGFANIKDFPEDFDIKENIGDELNICNRCGDIQNACSEMYWQGEECEETNIILDDHTAVCDTCYGELKKARDE
jgi:hypothetical protein